MKYNNNELVLLLQIMYLSYSLKQVNSLCTLASGFIEMSEQGQQGEILDYNFSFQSRSSYFVACLI